jgi:hypothetical protein
VRVLGTTTIGEDRCFVLDFIQGRDPDWVRRPFFARYDPWARWLDELEPAFGAEQFFFEEDNEAEPAAEGSRRFAPPRPTAS